MAEISKTMMVKNFIFEEIKAGRIKIGQRLPSCREVSAALSINKITVNKAYNELEKDHKVYSIPRGGFYLADFEDSLRVVQESIDFRTVKPENKFVPYLEFTHVMNNAINMYKSSLFEYERTCGLPSLRNTLMHEFEKDGVYTTSKRIVITNGAQQAISLVLQSVFKNKKGRLLIEVPTYNLVLKLVNYLGIDITGIERRIDGFDYKELERIFKSGEISAFYIIPRHHNPTGYILSERDKQKIAELSCKYNVLIIEDDYLADFGSGRGSMPIHYYDISKRTVYIRSFSKIFMPGIRIGAAVLPEFMLEEVIELKHISDLNTSKIPQGALDIFIKSGMYEKHIKKVKMSYEAKLKRATEIFKALCPEGLCWHIPEHGMYIWLQLPEYIEALELEKALEQQGILIKAAGEFFLEGWAGEKAPRFNNCIRLCISGVSMEHIDTLTTVISVIVSWNKIK